MASHGLRRRKQIMKKKIEAIYSLHTSEGGGTLEPNTNTLSNFRNIFSVEQTLMGFFTWSFPQQQKIWRDFLEHTQITNIVKGIWL